MDAQLELGEHAFGVYTAGQRVSWRYVAGVRARQGLFLGAFADGRPAGAAMIHDLRQWWVGREVPCAGIASVKVAPELRGRGVGRRLMTTVLETAAERGYPLSALFPATMPIYRSLGWELAGGKYQATIPARSLWTLAAADKYASAAAHGTPAGAPAAEVGRAGAGDAPQTAVAGADVRRAGPDDAAAIIAVIGRAHQAARDAGGLTWDEGPFRQWLARSDLYSYLVGDDGFAAYRWGGDGPHGELFVERVHARTPEALRALWSVIASHSSVARTVTALTAPNDPFWWLTAERDATISKRSMWMLRVVDAPAAIAARGFPPTVSAAVRLEISDSARPVNSGSWQLEVADGKGALAPAASSGRASSGRASSGRASSGPGAAVPLSLGARGLAALYAGTPVATLRLAGLVSGGAPDSDAALDAAFAATAYMVDDF
jgi:predicted acetyltransferase